jgi:hypothetical protein
MRIQHKCKKCQENIATIKSVSGKYDLCKECLNIWKNSSELKKWRSSYDKSDIPYLKKWVKEKVQFT